MTQKVSCLLGAFLYMLYLSMLKKLIVTEVDGEGWFLTFNGLMTTEESIKVDEQTAKTILALQQIAV